MTVQIQDITERPVLLLGWSLDLTVYPTGVGSSEAVGTAQANTTIAVSGVAPAGAVGSAQVNAALSVDGIAAGSGAVGSPALRAVVAPSGLASGATVGTAKANVTAPVAGVGSSAALGTTTAFTSMNITGFASTGAVGNPSLNLVMSPDGVAGTELFGDADTIATVFIIPGPVDPSNDFGTVTVTRKGWLFRTPRNTYQWRMFKEYEGISLLREDGVWSEVAHPDLERTLAAQVYLGGGRDHFLDDVTKDELVALGYTVTEEFIL